MAQELVVVDINPTFDRLQSKIDNILLRAKLKGYKVKKEHITIALSIALMLLNTHAYASTNIASRIMSAFKPLIDVIRGIGNPIFYLVESAGAITLFFDTRKGMKIMKNGIVAYLVLQFLPILINIMTDVGSAIESGH